MKTNQTKSVVVLLMLISGIVTAEPRGTAFTYQGQLAEGGQPANGIFDLRFTIFDLASGGSAVAGPLTNAAVAVSNGLFTVALDFGAGVFAGDACWLDIGVRTNGSTSDFKQLSLRQPLTPSPYALFAPSAGVAATATSVVTGSISNAALAVGAGDSSRIADGTIAAEDLGPTLPSNTFWLLSGNAGTTAGTQFLGTTDNQPLQLQVLGRRAFRLEPTTNETRDFGFSPSIVGGYEGNIVATDAVGATIAGGGREGYIHQITAPHGTIGGGDRNTVNGEDGTIAGGGGNVVSASYGFIGGGLFNTIETNAVNATVGGGQYNKIASDAYRSVIAGGVLNDIGPGARNSAIGGGYDNNIAADAFRSVIPGGLWNGLDTNAFSSTIGGGERNTVQSNAHCSTISGGTNHTIEVDSRYSTIGRGVLNTIQDSATCSVIGGGWGNIIGTVANIGTIGGGMYNTIQNYAEHSVIAGVRDNTVSVNAQDAAIGGGTSNTIAPGGIFGTIPGGGYNNATNYAFAAGRRAKAYHSGAFVWADWQTFDFPSTNFNEFAVRHSGGVRFTSGLAGDDQTIAWTPGSAGWSTTSDRNTKEHFALVDCRVVLKKLARLPVSEWNYKCHAQRHIGPMAQDFHALFPLNDNDRMIDSGDLQGVTAAAIQGLNEKLESGKRKAETQIAELKAENAELRRELAELKQLVRQLLK